MKAEEVAAAVRRHFGAERDGMGPEWAALSEFSVAPGGGSNRCDLFLVRAWRGRPLGHERIAVEIKVDRSDLRSELADPFKRQPFASIAHRFYFATPVGLFGGGLEVPSACGLIEVTGNGARKVKVAPRTDPEDPGHEAFVEAFRRASRAEARVRSATEDDPAAVIASLRSALAATESQRTTARGAVHREEERNRSLVALVVSLMGDRPIPCHCRHGDLRGHGWQWRHVERLELGVCRRPFPDANLLTTPERSSDA